MRAKEAVINNHKINYFVWLEMYYLFSYDWLAKSKNAFNLSIQFLQCQECLTVIGDVISILLKQRTFIQF